MPEVRVDLSRCTGCSICADFCPVEVFDMVNLNGDSRQIAQATRMQDCWACDTCVGQCPEHAIQIIESAEEAEKKNGRHGPFAEPIPAEEKRQYQSWHKTLIEILGLRWNPVAIRLIPNEEPLPDVPMPRAKLRHCQSMMAARRGHSLLMPAHCHACPDGTHILGLTEIPAKLASGELYLQFKKLASMEAARHRIHTCWWSGAIWISMETSA